MQVEGNNPLNRLESASINISYPWVEGEMHEIVLITSSGATFVSEIELATETPRFEMEQLLAYGLVGVYVGIIPVGLGLLWYPAMRRLSRKGMDFILAITVGMLVFLLVDTFLEAIEISSLLPEVYQGVPLVLFVALLTWLGITAIGNRQSVADRDSPAGRRFLALLIATGIGFHNLGEGLVVGVAFALVILHNITEGVGIAAPVTNDKIPARWFIIPLLIAGAPAILGTLIGGFAFSPALAVIFLGIGVGAIWQVIFEVGQLLKRNASRNDESLINWANVSGLLVGIAVMYFTAFFVKF